MYRLIALILVPFFLAGSGCSDRFKTKEQLLGEGTKLLNAGNPNGAIIYFRNALEKDQNFFDARFQLAKAYVIVGKTDEAEKELLKVSRQNPGSKEINIELAKVYVQKEQPDTALKEVEAYLGETVPDPRALEVAGRAYALKGDSDKAITLLKKAKASASGKDALSMRLSLARVFSAAGRHDEAKAELGDILRKEPSNRAALYTLAEIQTAERDRDAAIRTYDTILQYNPSEIEPYLRKGMLNIDKGASDEALAVSDKIIKVFPKRPEGYRLKGIAFFYKKDFNEAIVALQESLAIQPYLSTYYFLGLCHYYRGELEQAMGHFQKALEIRPAFVQARVLVSLIHLKRNRIDDAISEIRKAMESDEKNALAHNILGSAYMAKGLYSEGMSELNKAIEFDPRLVDVYIKKGLFDISSGNFRDAESELRTAVRVNPDMLYSRALLAASYMKQNDYDKALQVLSDGLKGQKADAYIYDMIADVMVRQNKTAEAIDALKKAKASDPKDFNAYFNLAALYLRQGERDRAFQELRSITEKAPDNAKALISLASMLETRGDGEAVKYYVRAKDTGSEDGYVELGKYYVRKNDHGQALKTCEEGVRKYPSSAALLELKGLIFLRQNRFDDAIRAFGTLGRVNPQSGIMNSLNVYIAMKRPDKAIDMLRKEIAKDPEKLELRAETARIYMMMGKKQEAIDTARDIVRQKPGSKIGYLALALLYRDSKDTDNAIEILKQASRLNDVDIFMMLGKLCSDKKDYKAALEAYKKAEDSKAGYVPAVFQRGSTYYVMNKKKEAEVEFRRVLRLSPDYVPALNNLAYLYAENNRDLAKALQFAAKAYAISPQDGSVQDTLGLILLKNGKSLDALRTLKKAAETLQNNPSVYYHLALAYKEQGDTRKTIESLKKALATGDFPDAASARQLLSRLQKS